MIWGPRELTDMARKIGSPHKDIYIMDDDERAAVCEGLQQAERGEFVSDEEMDAFWKEILGALSHSADDVRQGEFATDEEVQALFDRYRPRRG